MRTTTPHQHRPTWLTALISAVCAVGLLLGVSAPAQASEMHGCPDVAYCQYDSTASYNTNTPFSITYSTFRARFKVSTYYDPPVFTPAPVGFNNTGTASFAYEGLFLRVHTFDDDPIRIFIGIGALPFDVESGSCVFVAETYAPPYDTSHPILLRDAIYVADEIEYQVLRRLPGNTRGDEAVERTQAIATTPAALVGGVGVYPAGSPQCSDIPAGSGS